MRTKLHKFVSTKGQHLPDNFFRYKSGGEADYLCPFCDNASSSIPLIFFPQYGTTEGATYTTAFMCFNCAEDVVLMENELAGPPVRGGLFDQIEDTAKARIELFVKHGKFDSSVDLHYQHLDKLAFPNQKTCYACKQPAPNAYICIQAPVRGDAAVLTGGLVRICQGCKLFAKSEHGIDLNTETPNVSNHANGVDRCPKCEVLYLIDAHEVEYRGSFETVSTGRHLCPKCAHTALIGTGPNENDWVDRRNRLVYDTDTASQRYYEHYCHYCTEQFLLDATINQKDLFEQHMSATKKIMCTDCYNGIAGGPIHVIILDYCTIGFYNTAKSDSVRIIIKPSNGIIKDYVVSGDLPDLVQQLMGKYSERKLIM